MFLRRGIIPIPRPFLGEYKELSKDCWQVTGTRGMPQGYLLLSPMTRLQQGPKGSRTSPFGAYSFAGLLWYPTGDWV